MVQDGALYVCPRCTTIHDGPAGNDGLDGYVYFVLQHILCVDETAWQTVLISSGSPTWQPLAYRYYNVRKHDGMFYAYGRC